MKKLMVILLSCSIIASIECNNEDIIYAAARLVDKAGEDVGIWVRPTERQLRSLAGALGDAFNGNNAGLNRLERIASNPNIHRLPEAPCEVFVNRYHDEVRVGVAVVGIIAAILVIRRLLRKPKAEKTA